MNYDYLSNQSFDVLADADFDALESGPALIFDAMADAEYDALSDADFDGMASYTIHMPFTVGAVNDYASLYIITNTEDYAT